MQAGECSSGIDREQIGGSALKVKKGEFGYLNKRKKEAVIWIILLAAIALAIYIVGLLLNKMSNRNVFTIIAILFALPIAKQLVAVIVLFPYHSVGQERYQKAADHLPEKMELMADLVITSTEHVMHLDFLVLGQNQVIGLLGDGKQQLSEVRSYLKNGVQNWGSDYKVKIVDSEKLFFQELQTIPKADPDPEEEEKVRIYLRSLIV